MVIDDTRTENSSKNTDMSTESTSPREVVSVSSNETNDVSKNFEARLASPRDRAAAAVADMVIFAPIAAVAIAPFKKASLEAQLIGSEAEWLSSIIGAGFAGLLALLLYQTVFIALFGATPGKWALRLRVESIWTGARPKPLEALLRSVVWSLELALMGVPWLAVFADERRRPFHDRISETAVVALAEKRSAGKSPLHEMAIASGVQAACLASTTFVLLSALFAQQRGTSDLASRTIAELEEKNYLCSEVRTARDEWPSNEKGTKPSRLEVALTLQAVDAIDEECLRSEADYSIWREQEKTLAYFAKGISETEGSQLADGYLAKVCVDAPKSDECRATQFFAAVASASTESAKGESRGLSKEEGVHPEELSKEEELEQQKAFEKALSEIGPDSKSFLKIYAIRNAMETHRPEFAIELIDGLRGSKYLGPFLAQERSKALWLLGQNKEAQSALLTSAPLLDESERVEFARWFCSSETIEGGCAAVNEDGCRLFSESVSQSDRWLSQPKIAATFLKSEACAGRLDEKRTAQLATKILDKSTKDLLKAFRESAAGESNDSLEPLRALIESSEVTNPVFFEAGLRLTDLSRQPEDFAPLTKAWLKTERFDEEWVGLGKSMIRRLVDLKAWDRALEVGLKLRGVVDRDPKVLRSMVVAAHRSGKNTMATELLTTVVRIERERAEYWTEGERMPASLKSDGFDQVVAEMLGRSAAQ